MNKQMNLPALTKIMRDFERQNEKMEMTSEMMGDAVDDAFEVPHRHLEHPSVSMLALTLLMAGTRQPARTLLLLPTCGPATLQND